MQKVIIEERWIEWGENYKITHKNVLIWEGECRCVYFSSKDTDIRQPDYVSAKEDEIRICYPQHSNVRVRKDENNYLWCEPAMSIEELKKLKVERNRSKKKRNAVLSRNS